MRETIRALTAAVVRLTATVFALTFVAVPSAKPQAFKVIYSFGSGTAAHPIAGLTMDARGNLYGTSAWGGTSGNGTVYELQRTNAGFVYSTLHNFAGGSDGSFPWGGVTIGADGALYGTTGVGGTRNGGTIFRVARTCQAGPCTWNETVLYRFTGGNDGRNPQAGVVFDRKGNLYGTTANGGSGSVGVVYELSPSGSNWNYHLLYGFDGKNGANPGSLVMFDSAGNICGTAETGGNSGCLNFGCGTVYELTPSGSGWRPHTLYTFQDGQDGAQPVAGLIQDSSGNLYGATCCGDSTGGTAFELSPSGGVWTFNLIYELGGLGPGPTANLVQDKAGNLYGSSWGNGLYGQGVVFKLTPPVAATERMPRAVLLWIAQETFMAPRTMVDLTSTVSYFRSHRSGGDSPPICSALAHPEHP